MWPSTAFQALTRMSWQRFLASGLTSASLPSNGIVSSPAKQARWIRRQIQLLDHARARYAFQLTFTDLDLTGVPLPPGSILPLFAAVGLVDVNLAPKLSLAPWDSAFARPAQ